MNMFIYLMYITKYLKKLIFKLVILFFWDTFTIEPTFFIKYIIFGLKSYIICSFS